MNQPTKKEIIDALERGKDELTSTLTICRKAINEVADDHPKWDSAREALTDVCYEFPNISPDKAFEIAIQQVEKSYE